MPTKDSSNLVINVPIIPTAQKGFDVFISDKIVDLQCMSNGQVFPLYWYEEKKESVNIFDQESREKYTKNYSITDETLTLFTDQYYGIKITKEDIFYYIYGVFHSPTFRNLYKNNLTKEFPRVPFLVNFKAYCEIGRKLAQLHINYEKTPQYSGVKVTKAKDDYNVSKIRFEEKDKKTTIIFNDWIKIDLIPLEAYSYVINGRSPIEWVIDQYQYSVDKESGIVNDPNTYSKNGGKYVFDLLLSLITLSIETTKLINELPKYEEIE
jgi:predicted helicase